MIKILLADDHTTLRQSLSRLIEGEPDLTVAAETEDFPTTVATARRVLPDVVLLDLGMPGRGGVETVQSLRQLQPPPAILILTARREDYFAIQLLREGAAGYLPKEVSTDELLAAIRKVAKGGKYIRPSLAETIAMSLDPEAEKKPHHRLSDRELEVFLHLAAGRTPTEIAELLNLSVKTISTHRGRILEKMGLTNNAELILYAVREELIW